MQGGRWPLGFPWEWVELNSDCHRAHWKEFLLGDEIWSGAFLHPHLLSSVFQFGLLALSRASKILRILGPQHSVSPSIPLFSLDPQAPRVPDEICNFLVFGMFFHICLSLYLELPLLLSAPAKLSTCYLTSFKTQFKGHPGSP